jgi:hypothetical protein
LLLKMPSWDGFRKLARWSKPVTESSRKPLHALAAKRFGSVMRKGLLAVA